MTKSCEKNLKFKKFDEPNTIKRKERWRDYKGETKKKWDNYVLWLIVLILFFFLKITKLKKEKKIHDGWP